jgi:hypothetical protein
VRVASVLKLIVNQLKNIVSWKMLKILLGLRRLLTIVEKKVGLLLVQYVKLMIYFITATNRYEI